MRDVERRILEKRHTEKSKKGSIPKLVLDFMYQIVHGYIRPEVLVRNAPGSG